MRNVLDSSMAGVTDFPEAEAVNEANRSGVSWAAVIGGALVIAALSLILLALGAGLGLASISPWSGSGVAASTIGGAAILWLIVMQIAASAMGGYLAGRLRTKWTRIHSDEVFFRDTAHGFLAWALAAVLTAAFLSSAAASMIGSAEKSPSTAPDYSSSSTEIPIPMGAYFVDRLFRSDHLEIGNSDLTMRSEAGRVFANVVLHHDSPEADKSYLSHLVALKTQLSEPDAEKRVTDVIADSQRELDKARKAAMHLSVWTFIALLCGAFIASVSATVGGRQRDNVVVN